MNLALLLAFAALVPESATQKQVRLLEERLHPFPPAALVTENAISRTGTFSG